MGGRFLNKQITILDGIAARNSDDSLALLFEGSILTILNAGEVDLPGDIHAPSGSHFFISHRDFVPADEYVTIGAGPGGTLYDRTKGLDMAGGLYGLSVQPAFQLTGNELEHVGLYANVQSLADGSLRTVTQQIAVKIDNLNKFANVAVTTAYGLYIQAITSGTTNVGIYNNNTLHNVGKATLDGGMDITASGMTVAGLSAIAGVSPVVDTHNIITLGKGAGVVADFVAPSGYRVGMFSQPSIQLTGTVAEVDGLNIQPNIFADGQARTLTALYDIFIQDAGADANTTITTTYGIYIGALSAHGGSTYAIYTAGAGNPSYLGGKVGLGVATATAVLHLKAGTATANTSPLKFNAGTNLTALEIGAVEFTDDGTNGHLYITLNVAGVLTRKQIV